MTILYFDLSCYFATINIVVLLNAVVDLKGCYIIVLEFDEEISIDLISMFSI